MSVDVRAVFGFGWVVETKEAAGAFDEMEDQEFAQLEELDGIEKYRGSDWCVVLDGYVDNSNVCSNAFIGWRPKVGIPFDEFIKQLDGIEDKLRIAVEVYKKIMGHAPAEAPKVLSLTEYW